MWRLTVNNYNAPVFHGGMNGAQIVWNSSNVTQTQQTVERVTPGFEKLAQAVTQTLAQLPRFGLAAEDSEDAAASANEILVEVVQGSPDRSRIRRSLAALRGFLQPVAVQAALGAGEGSHELAKAQSFEPSARAAADVSAVAARRAATGVGAEHSIRTGQAAFADVSRCRNANVAGL